MSETEEPFNLWGLARLLLPHRVADYFCWTGAGRESDTIRALAENDLAAHPLSFLPPERSAALERAKDRQVGWLQLQAEMLIATELPHDLRPHLLSGHYTVTGRRNGQGERIGVMLDDLAGLSVELRRNRLTGPTVTYEEITVRRAAAAPAAPVETTLREPNHRNVHEKAEALLANGSITRGRGSRKQLVEALMRVYPGAARETIERYASDAHAVWSGRKKAAIRDHPG